jgi:hypothetical protein
VIGRDELLLVRYCYEKTHRGEDADEQELVPTGKALLDVLDLRFAYGKNLHRERDEVDAI